ncbi:hypothetical protein ACRQ1B_11685 [Rhizobium panacihumi]|uniref:hypothetical protein n=1 Tax=Rhizobium panacihumi TaxID=2008450 RepID=UPI003D7A0CD9
MTAAPVALSRASAGPTSSVELLGLSGQLRLGQSLSVFAETLGSLLKLPRREGEALTDYSKRLAAAINALNAVERAKLQIQLNQIMQGATLRLLTELLKDPSGPASARLAVQIEIAQYQGKDLAAGHAVNSYRQNNGNEAGHLPANANTATGSANDQRGSTISGVSGTPDHSDNDTSAESPAPPRSAGEGTTSTKASIERDNSGAIKPGADAAPQSSPEKLVVSGRDGSIGNVEGPHLAGDAGNPLAHPRTASAETIATGEPELIAAEEPGVDASPRSAAQTTERNEATSSNAKTGADTQTPARNDSAPRSVGGAIYDAAVLIRRAHDKTDMPGLPSPERTVDQFVSEWVSELPVGKPEPREWRQGLTSQANTAAMGEPLATEFVPEDGNEAGPHIRTARTADGEAVIPQANAFPTSATAPNAATIAQQTDAAFEKALLGMMMLPAREPPAHPLVPHVAAQEFDDSQEHDIKRKPAVGDDGQPSRQGSGGGHSSQGEEQTAQDEVAAETVLSQISTDAPVELDITPVKQDLRAAPRQHLSNHPAQNAEDFYRRLAVLE